MPVPNETIQAGQLATSTTTSPGSPILSFLAVPSWVVPNMVIFDISNPGSGFIPAATVLSKTAQTVTMSANAGASGVGSGDNIVFSQPSFAVVPGVDYTIFSPNLPNLNGLVVQCPATGVTTVAQLLAYFGFGSSSGSAVAKTNVPARATGAFTSYGQSGKDIFD